MTKLELMKLVLTADEMSHCDTAIPMSLWEGIDTSLHVYDCKNGKLINLAEAFFQRMTADGIMKELSELRYLNKLYKKKLNIKSEEDNFNLAMEMD